MQRVVAGDLDRAQGVTSLVVRGEPPLLLLHHHRLTLVVPAAETGAAVPAHGVDLVDEDDAGRVRLPLLEEVANAARADADEHLDEVRAGNGEERGARFTSQS